MDPKTKYKYGFTLGKFMPPHKGHEHMILSALKKVEQLTVLVCTVKKEPIEGGLRFKWMQELFSGNENVHLIHVTDEVPSYPNEHPDFQRIWTDLLRKYIHPETSVFISSEEYGNDVARWLNFGHLEIDKSRAEMPVSSTAIRSNPLGNWSFIPDHVRPYFLKRIVLTGPESTGKTILAEKLARHFKTSWVPEFGRTHYEKVNGKLTLEDISIIANEHIKLEEEKALTADKLLFCDTDLIVTQIWSEIYFQECPSWIKEKNQIRKYDLFLLMDIDIPWVDDGTREFPHLREWHFNRLKQELNSCGSNYKIISGDYETRFETAKREIEKLISNTNNHV